MKEVKLTQGMVALVDDDMFEELDKFKWSAHKCRKIYYARRGVWDGKKSKTVRMHQMILEPRPGYETDHIDGDSLNNQRENLRYATSRQNGANKGERSGTSSRFKGVCWHKLTKKWMSQINGNGVRKYLGLYVNESDAALAYDHAARDLFGEFARTNF